MLNFLIFIFTTSIIGILIICYFFLNNDFDKEHEEKEDSMKNKSTKVTSKGKKVNQSDKTKYTSIVSNVEDLGESIESSEQVLTKEILLREKILQLEKELNSEHLKTRTLELELKEEKVKFQEQIRDKLDHVISRFEIKILDVINKSGEKVDKLLSLNQELLESNKQKTKQEVDLLRFQSEFMSKLDLVIRTLENRRHSTEAKEMDEQ